MLDISKCVRISTEWYAIYVLKGSMDFGQQFHSGPIAPTNKDFARFFSLVFIVISAIFFANNAFSLGILLILISALFIVLAHLKPDSLEFLNKFWFKIGVLLSKITNPVVLGFIFLVIITPVAVITRLFGRDELRIKYSSDNTYWVDKIRSNTNASDFKNQF